MKPNLFFAIPSAWAHFTIWRSKFLVNEPAEPDLRFGPLVWHETLITPQADLAFQSQQPPLTVAVQ